MKSEGAAQRAVLREAELWTKVLCVYCLVLMSDKCFTSVVASPLANLWTVCYTSIHKHPEAHTVLLHTYIDTHLECGETCKPVYFSVYLLMCRLLFKNSFFMYFFFLTEQN